MFPGCAHYKRRSSTYRSNIFCCKNKWRKNREAVKKRKAISQLNNETLNHRDLFNHIYLKLVHTQMQAFQRWWIHLDFWMLKLKRLKTAWFLDNTCRGFSKENSMPTTFGKHFVAKQRLSVFTSHKCCLSHLEEIITSSFPFTLKAQGVHDCRSFQTLGLCWAS